MNKPNDVIAAPLQSIVIPHGGFRCILADPPWSYGSKKPTERLREGLEMAIDLLDILGIPKEAMDELKAYLEPGEKE